VKSLVTVKQVSKEELPKRVEEVAADQLLDLLTRFQGAVERPLEAFAEHLKPALFRQIHVGTMDYMGESHESYRRTFEFIETTNTWFDTDSPERDLPATFRINLGCGYKSPSEYQALGDRARDSFKMVIKVSCVATHILKLKDFLDWWPRLYREKYSKLEPATVAFLFVYSNELYTRPIARNGSCSNGGLEQLTGPPRLR
ncbi:unnamed protein product, partial [Polarella glacialis]